MKRKLLMSALCMSTLSMHLWAQAAANTKSTAAAQTVTAPATPESLEELRTRIAAQQEQIKKLQQAMEEQQQILGKMQAAASATSTASTSSNAAAKPADTAATMVPVVNLNSLRPDVASLPRRMQQNETRPSPLSIRLGNATLTPLGFMDLTFFARSTNTGAGIGSNFGSIPFNNVAASHLSETGFSAQNSRLGFRVDSNVMGAKVLGYLEADFLFNNNAASVQTTSNANGFRMRNYFVDVQKDGFEVLGGQDWSLLTPNRVGLSPVPSDIFYTQNMDTNYQAGLVWTRAAQVRFIAHPNENVAFGVALENAQQSIGGGGGGTAAVLPSGLASALATQFNGASGATQYNVPNWFPDIIAKAAYDGHAGDKLMHVEIAGLVSGFKNYILPSTLAAAAGSHTAIGFGGEVNANLQIVKNVHLIANTFFSDGGGRYIFGLAPDVVVRPDGSISPLHSYSTVDGLEFQIGKSSQLAFYYGGAYVGKNYSFDPTAAGSTLAKPSYSGYGFPGSTLFNRAIQELTVDYTKTLWKNSNYGALSLINQYSYVIRDPWTVTTGAPKSAHTNLVYVDLRYTLP
jgi:uncharacterized coiled-coil protein SlyX